MTPEQRKHRNSSVIVPKSELPESSLLFYFEIVHGFAVTIL